MNYLEYFLAFKMNYLKDNYKWKICLDLENEISILKDENQLLIYINDKIDKIDKNRDLLYLKGEEEIIKKNDNIKKILQEWYIFIIKVKAGF